MARGKRVTNTHRPIYEASAAYTYTKPTLHQRKGIGLGIPTWMWGCGLLSLLGCAGFCVLSMVLMPMGFRLLAPEYQDAVIRHFPAFSILLPVREGGNTLPTADPARAATALALIGTPDSSSVGATPTFRPTAVFTPLPVRYIVQNHKRTPQTFNNCGPANLVEAAFIQGVTLAQSDVAAWLKPDSTDANVSPWQLAAYATQYTQLHSIVRVGGNLTLLKRLISSGLSVIVETGDYEVGKPHENQYWMGHYLTIVGWDDAAGYLNGLDTLESGTAGDDTVHEQFADFDERWQHFDRTYVVMYQPDAEAKLQDILGSDYDPTTNAQNALNKSIQEAQGNPNSAFAWFNTGTNYVLMKEYQKAAAAYDRARSVGNGLPWRMLWYQFGPYSAYYATGDFQQVIQLAENTLKSLARVHVEETLYYRGIAEAALGTNDTALADFQKAVQLNTNFSPALKAIQELQSGTKPLPQALIISSEN